MAEQPILDPTKLTIVHWSGDWAALADEDGNVLDQGHWSDLQERVLERVGVTMEFPGGDFPWGRRVPDDANLKEYM